MFEKVMLQGNEKKKEEEEEEASSSKWNLLVMPMNNNIHCKMLPEPSNDFFLVTSLPQCIKLVEELG